MNRSSETRNFNSCVINLSDYNKKSQLALVKNNLKSTSFDSEELQDRPKINENSRKYLPNYIPIHKRVNDLMRKKNDYLKALRHENEMKKRTKEESECTFVPSTISKLKRDPSKFTEGIYN